MLDTLQGEYGISYEAALFRYPAALAFAQWPAICERNGGEWQGPGFATRRGLRAMRPFAEKAEAAAQQMAAHQPPQHIHS